MKIIDTLKINTVHFIGHGAIQIAALLPTVIEPASNVAAIGFGIAGGVATGPV